MDPIDEIFRSLQPHPSKAQILLEIEDEGKTLEEARQILLGSGIGPIEYHFMRKGNPLIVLFYLPTNDIADVVLKLTEAGFDKLHSINSRPS